MNDNERKKLFWQVLILGYVFIALSFWIGFMQGAKSKTPNKDQPQSVPQEER